MAEAARALDDADLARWLTTEVPRSIVERSKLPPRPERAKRRGLFRR
jgi:hypothetical protein